MSNDAPGLAAAKRLVEWADARVVPAFINGQGLKIPLGGTWTKTATKDFETLEGWWQKYPYAWVGVVSGPGSVLVLDADGPAAVAWLRSYLTERGGWEGAWVYSTPGRGSGIHMVWKWADWLGDDFSQAKILMESGDIQLRGRGHFTIVAGARRADGVYTVLHEPEVLGEAPEALLQPLLDMAGTMTTRGVNISGEVKAITPEEAWAMAPLVDGRKNTLAGLAWRAALTALCYDDVLSLCLLFNEQVCSPSLPEAIVRIKAEYAWKRAEEYKARNEREIETLQAIYKRNK